MNAPASSRAQLFKTRDDLQPLHKNAAITIGKSIQSETPNV